MPLRLPPAPPVLRRFAAGGGTGAEEVIGAAAVEGAAGDGTAAVVEEGSSGPKRASSAAAVGSFAGAADFGSDDSCPGAAAVLFRPKYAWASAELRATRFCCLRERGHANQLCGRGQGNI